MKTKSLCGRENSEAGLTLVELLVVIAVLAVLFAVLIPVILGRGHRPSSAVACMNNVRQLAIGWFGYSSDNQDQLMPNPGWVGGTMGWSKGGGLPEYFDEQQLLNPSNSLMADYLKSVYVYQCPKDQYQLPTYPGRRVRSYSLNGALDGGHGAGPTVQGNNPNGRNYFGNDSSGTNRPARKTSDLVNPGPAMIFVIVEEHPDSIGDGTFLFDPGYPVGSERWRDLPAIPHRGSGCLAFADGHGEIHKWKETNGGNTTLYPVTMIDGNRPWEKAVGASQDYEWMQDRMPYR